MFCLQGFLSGGVLARGVFVRGVFGKGGFVQGVFVWGFMSGGGFVRGVFVLEPFRTQCSVSRDIAWPVASACKQNLSVQNENQILSRKSQPLALVCLKKVNNNTPEAKRFVNFNMFCLTFITF